MKKRIQSKFLVFYLICLITTNFFYGNGLFGDRSASLQLAKELFEEEDWKNCEIETRKILVLEPFDTEAKLLYAKALAWQGIYQTTIFVEVANNSAVASNIRAEAFYYLAMIAYARRERDKTFTNAAQALLISSDSEILKMSAFLVVKSTKRPMNSSEKDILEQAKKIIRLYNVNECQMIAKIRRFVNKGTYQQTFISRLGNSLISFYRCNIRPAIGDRCSLSPSCSEYTRQAFVKYGIMAFPMMADRFYREPGIVSKAEKPVIMEDGKICFSDPLEDHSWYFKKNGF